jgi:hypothetical protein
LDFSKTEPIQLSPMGSRTWLLRGANFVVTYTEAAPGDTFSRNNPDEYVVYLPEASASIVTGADSHQLGPRTVAIIPPDMSAVSLPDGGRMVRIFSSQASDLASAAPNADKYADGARGVAPLEPLPKPVDGWKVRTYHLDDYLEKPMRLFRCTNLMVNIFDFHQPRDIASLSPHSHVDFEQGSLALAGNWRHHLRYPWTPNLAEWREDEHLDCGSPSLVIIPPNTIHTSHNISPGTSQLFDVFAPPRADFSAKGLVCNAKDYPAPPPI